MSLKFGPPIGIDTVVIQFNNTTDPKLYMWNLSEILINRIVKILRNEKKNITTPINNMSFCILN